MTRCLFCQTTDGKRSNEHVFRRAFKERFSLAPGLTFSWETQTGELEIVKRPVSQFDMTLNAVCRDCNQGWLEDLENDATAVIHELTVGNEKLGLSETEVRVLGFWAYIRGLLCRRPRETARRRPRGCPLADMRTARWRSWDLPDTTSSA